MILFLKILFNTWYKCVLFSLMLCKQLVHMYVIELDSIWIWKCTKKVLEFVFEKYLNYF